MTNEERIEALKNVKQDISANFINTCNFYNLDSEKLFQALNNIEGLFDLIIEFCKQDNNDNTSKNALILGIVNAVSHVNAPALASWIHQSSIEFLFYSVLNMSMPPRIWKKAFLMAQVPVCNNKYTLDLALMDRRDPEKDGTEGVPIVGIECDGYSYHFDDAKKATKKQERMRYINMNSGIKVFSYTGKEIYKNCIELASEFWDYVEKAIYPIE